jgi:DNA-binding MarR family transcriptional regulator
MRAIRQVYLVGVKADALISGVARRYGLSHAALNALAVIEGAGGPTPTGEVTARMHVTTATMTSVLDTLERNGYIRRTSDPDDRRKVLVDLTDEARELLDHVLTAVAQATTAAATDIDDETLEILVTSLGKVADGIAAMPADLPAPAPRRARRKPRTA